MLGLGAVEMRAFDCMRRVRAREVVARAYGDAGIRCADRQLERFYMADNETLLHRLSRSKLSQSPARRSEPRGQGV